MTQQGSVGDWCAAVLAALFARRPVDATFVGVHDHDARLPDLSPAGAAAESAELARLAGRLPAEAGPDPAHRLDRQVAEGYLASQIALLRSGHAPHRDPSAITARALFGVIGLLRRDFAPADQRLRAVAARSRAVPEALEQAAAAAADAPMAWVATARVHCRAGQALFATGVRRYCADLGVTFPDEAALDLAAQAFADLDATLAAAGPAGRRPAGCGAALLDLLLASTHHVPGGARTVEQMALAALDAATEALESGARAFGASWQTVLAELRADRVAPGEVPDHHLQVYRAQRQLAIDLGLVEWPDYPIRFVPVPPWLQGVMVEATVYPYAAAPLDPPQPVDFIIPDAPGGTDRTTILSNHILHHAGIGHHVQNWFAYHRATSRFGRLSAVDSAGYIVIHSGLGMAEGWSGYVPGMVAEFGLFDARQRLSLHHDALRGAARALIDVRLHRGTWTEAEAAAFLVARTGATEGAALAAVQRIAQAPSSGSMYLVGPTLLRRLREAVVGPAPDPRSLGLFHNRLLSYGSLPLPLIAAEMTGRGPDALI